MNRYHGQHTGTAIVRCDFNIPKDGSNLSKISDIEDTLKKLNNNKIVLLTHFGDIDQYDAEYSLVHIVPYIESTLKIKVDFCQSFDEVKNSKSRIILFENLRFNEGERKNDNHFAEQLASLGDFYINDAFATCHRKHASLNAIKKYTISYIGENLYKNIQILTPLLGKNYIWIIGGKKVLTKLQSIPRKSDIILGGVAANSYFSYHGFTLGQSEYVEYEMDQCHYIPPIDLTVNDRVINGIENLKYNESIIDVGPKTIEHWANLIKNRPCIWNGSIAINNKSKHQIDLLNAVSKLCPISIIGGGDMYIPDDISFTYQTNAGGALLHFMSHGMFDNIGTI